MNVLPLISRELRATPRQALTHWLRVLEEGAVSTNIYPRRPAFSLAEFRQPFPLPLSPASHRRWKAPALG